MSGALLTLFGGGVSPNTNYVVNVGQYTYGSYGASYINGFYSTYGSITPTTFSNTNSQIFGLDWNYNDRTGSTVLSFYVNGTQIQSVFTSMAVAGQVFASASATFYASGGTTTWQWNAPTNPFPTVGANVTAYFS